MRASVIQAPAILSILYDIGDPAGLGAARRHRGWWGKLYTDIFFLDENTVVLEFRPAPRLWWTEWEAERLRWILKDLEELAA